MPPLRTAILGCGGFGAFHARNLAGLPEQVSLAAFCDRHEERAAALAEQNGLPPDSVFIHPEDLFARAKFDLLVIALPPFAHGDEIEQCARRGIHVLIEKPVALTSDQAWRMVEQAEKGGICTQVGFMYRFGAAVTRLKALIESGESGAVGLVRAGYFCNHLHTHWWRSKELSGGQVAEQAIHLLDLMRHLAGEADGVFSLQRNLFHREVPGYTVEDVSGTVISFKSGAVGVLTATNAAIPDRWLWDFNLVSGGLTASIQDANHASLVHTRQSGTPEEKISASEDVYLLEVLDLLQAIRGGSPARVPLEEGARTLDLALAAVKSAETGQAVRFF